MADDNYTLITQQIVGQDLIVKNYCVPGKSFEEATAKQQQVQKQAAEAGGNPLIAWVVPAEAEWPA